MELFPILSPNTVEEGRDLRIRLLSEVFDATEQGLQVELTRREDIDAWHDGVSASLASMESLVQLITPLPSMMFHYLKAWKTIDMLSVVCAEEKFHYHILHCVVLCCRQCVLYNAILNCRKLLEDRYPLDPASPHQWNWFQDIQPHGVNIVPLWGKESIRNAEAVMLFTLQCDPACLATSPDILFAMIAFCGGIVIAMKFFMLRKLGVEMPGSGDLLLDQMVDLMSRASISDNHAPIRYANVVRNMLSTWRKTDKAALVREAWRLHHDFQQQSSTAGQTGSHNKSECGSESSVDSQNRGAGSPLANSQSPGGDFWSEFLQTIPVPQFTSPLGF